MKRNRVQFWNGFTQFVERYRRDLPYGQGPFQPRWPQDFAWWGRRPSYLASHKGVRCNCRKYAVSIAIAALFVRTKRPLTVCAGRCATRRNHLVQPTPPCLGRLYASAKSDWKRCQQLRRVALAVSQYPSARRQGLASGRLQHIRREALSSFSDRVRIAPQPSLRPSLVRTTPRVSLRSQGDLLCRRLA